MQREPSGSRAGGLLARCVSGGALSQGDLDSASSSPVFSSLLYETEQRIRMQRQQDELQLEMELLKLEKQSADVTHSFYLAQRFQTVQTFCSHLQNILREQNSLRQRLTRPLGRNSLPVHADHHRYVVGTVTMMLDFIPTLETSLSTLRHSHADADRLDQLNASLAHLLAQVGEVESLANQVLRWQDA